MKVPFLHLALCAALVLTGCAPKVAAPVTSAPTTVGSVTTPASPSFGVSTVVVAVQAAYGHLTDDASLWVALHPADAPTVIDLENLLGPQIKALSADTAPATISALITDLVNHVDALPTSMISATHKAEIDGLASLAELVMQFAPQVRLGPTWTSRLAWVEAPARIELVP